MEQSRHFTRCMGRWLMALVLVMLTSLAMRAAQAYPYAVYTPSNTTLTFYYDDQYDNRTGTVYDLPVGGNYPDWLLDGAYRSITRVVFNSSFAQTAPSNTSFWFFSMANLQSITGMKQYLNTSQVTDMSYMFGFCQKLASIDLSNFNTANVTKMKIMFSDCLALTSLDVSGFNTSKVTDMSGMFNNCPGLTSLDVSNFNTSKVTDMSGMFGNNPGLATLDLRNFNTSKVTGMATMFLNCSNLRTIYVSSGWSTSAVTNSVNMFADCTSLVGGAGTVYDANHVDVSYAHIDGGPSNPGYLTDPDAVAIEAYTCYTPSNTTLTFYYDNKRSTRTGTTYDLNEDGDIPGWCQDGTYGSVTRVVFNSSFANARPTRTTSWFFGMSMLQSITGMSYLNTSEVTNMSHMFRGCSSLTSIDLSSFNTAKVTSMWDMFRNCNSLTSLDVSGFNTSNVTDMEAMFYCCEGLTSLDVSSFNTSNVYYMSNMFYNCRSLTSLDVSGFNTSWVSYMEAMFSYCQGLKSLDLSGFNTSNVTTMYFMFKGCRNLFTIYVGNGWSTNNVTSSDYMFHDCASLVGGQGTAYDVNHIDKAYAHIDGGPGNPGYFTDKNSYIRGDVNGDREVDVADVALLIKVALGQLVFTQYNRAADLDDDHNSIDVGDVSVLINIVLGKAN